MVQNWYGIKPKCTTTENPQSKSILEHIRPVISNLVFTFNFKNNYLDNDYPWACILTVTAFLVHIVYDTTLQSISSQLMFGSYMILKTPFITYWEDIRRWKQELELIWKGCREWQVCRPNFKTFTHRYLSRELYMSVYILNNLDQNYSIYKLF